MNKYIGFIILIFATISGIAQSDSILLQRADRLKKGIFAPLRPDSAFKIYEQLAGRGNVFAMNALGVQYANGFGTDSNFNAALNWFTKAAANGYGKAYVNAGMLFKHRNADSTDFVKACSYFDSALAINDTSALFAKGYMLYKGFGCTQDYGNALTLFLQGAAAGRADCNYFAGLCFKNGYGIAVDTATANKYILTAAKKGYRQAVIELKFGNSENQEQSNMEFSSLSANTKPSIFNTIQANIPDSVSGVYEGFIQQYDYSGKHILQQTKLQLQLFKNGNNVTGTWRESDSIYTPIVASINENKEILFEQTAYKRMSNRVANKKTSLLKFQSAKLQWDNKTDSIAINGKVVMLDAKQNEPFKPLYLHLVRKAPNMTIAANHKTKAIVFPNPSGNTANVSIEASEATSVQISIYNLKGNCVYTAKPQNLIKGSNTISLIHGLPQGTYLLKYGGIDAGSTILIVKP